jgi:uncharacterized protein (TIGR00369 family)
MDGSNVRRRVVEWDDPVEAAKTGRGLEGRAYLEAITEGRIPRPPIAALVGFDLVEVGDGSAVFALKPGEEHYNPLGTVHGGIAATLLDSAMGCAVHTVLPQGRGYTTLEIKINYVRAMTRDTGRVRAEGTVIHAGRSVATAEARLVDEDGRLYAHGSTTCLIFEMPQKS